MTRRYWILGLLIVIAGFAIAAAMYPAMPDPMPSHWDAAGRVNGTMPRVWGVYLFPCITLVMWAVLAVLPRISPKGFEMKPFLRAWAILCLTMLAFMLFVEILVLRAARDGGTLSPRAVIVGAGVLIVVIGNFLGKVTRNFFAGIRTPWTLASEEVWNRTHRFAGKLFVLAGLAVIVAGLASVTVWPVLVVALAGAGLAAVVYSYVIYRRIEGFPARKSA